MNFPMPARDSRWILPNGNILAVEFVRYHGWVLQGQMFGNPNILARELKKRKARPVPSSQAVS